MERLAIGWLVLDMTGSIFLTASSFAIQNLPSMFVGPVAGTLADRMERKLLLAITSASKAVIMAGIGLVAVAGTDALLPVMLLVLIGSSARSFSPPATQALITDIMGTANPTHAIGVHSIGARSVGVLGALTGGLLIDALDAGPVFFIGAALSGLAVWAFLSIPVEARTRAVARGPIWRDVFDGLRTMIRIPVVAVLLALALAVEIFAFSHVSLLPVVAKRVLSVGPTGLGALTLFAGLGGVVGSVFLSLIRARARRGLVILGVTVGYGAFLVAFAASSIFPLSLVLIAGVGAMATLFDGFQWALLQANVPAAMRGRAIGGWIWAIGFGWVGPIMLGGAAEAVGVQITIAASGAIVVLLAIGAAVLVPRLRQA